MRKLATVQTITAIDPIEGADAIEVASIQGWKVVVKKGEHNVGDKVVYLEIDSWVPNCIAPFLSKNTPRVYEGVPGERLKTIRLRGQISQGLVLPLSVVPQSYGLAFSANDGEDLTELLNIKKWEAQIPANLAGVSRGSFPCFLHKTDEERIQNIADLLPSMIGITFAVHEKLDGSSMTVYNNGGDFGVCSRNLNLKETDENSFWQIARKYNLREVLPEGYCIQGELIGPGVQKNRYGLCELDLYVFNVYDIVGAKYLDDADAKAFARGIGLKWVPHVWNRTITETTTVDELLEFAEGKSLIGNQVEREGVVYRPLKEMEMRKLGRLSFKTISNKFLLGGGD